MLINFKKLNGQKIFKFSIIILLLIAIIIVVYYSFKTNENFYAINNDIFVKCFEEDNPICFKTKMTECMKTENNKNTCISALLEACQKNVASGNSSDPNECNELKDMIEKLI